ncbi:nuclease-related domain-containing protein [Desulfosporosinus nitroreducens]|uniref:NERD domain-containing protein n=1 Tax=Desulfosporosinus nitroreducens TaxID=2018668 RepID=A0ABT8QP06_9FIRM|nr:nuclease-related domain-containing protein [Desulfosporosinus nitroreducens]MDO0823088.1 NERD domain-containing protein [Desulfosporosinus nitroreducens]
MAIYLGRDSLINKKVNASNLTSNLKKGLDGEIAVGDLLERFLPEDTYLISHPIIGKYEPDFLVISPRYGFRLIEVKHWELKPIKSALPNGTFEFVEDIRNPLDQVRKHIEDLNAYLLSTCPEINSPYQLIGCAVVNYGFCKNDFVTKFSSNWNPTATQDYFNFHIFKDQLNQKIDRILHSATKYPGSSPKLSNEFIKAICSKLCISEKYATDIEIEMITETKRITNEFAEQLKEQDQKNKILYEIIEKNIVIPPEPKRKGKLILALAGALLTIILLFAFNNIELVTQHSGQRIKGNINAKGEKIYHVPSGKYYDSTIPEEWFLTEKDAQQAGFRRSQM